MTSIPPPGIEQPDPPPPAPRPPTGGESSARPGGAQWPPWIGAAALVGALVAITVVGSIIAFAWTGGAGRIPPGALQLTTYLQDFFFVAAAFGFAALVAGRVSAADFGLVATPVWRALALAIGVGIGFYVLSAAWVSLIGVKSKDDVTDLGFDDSVVLTVTGLILLTVVAPIAEEILFRGLIFRSLRNWAGLWPAALITGVVFGGIHAASSPVAFLVPLAILGVGLCLLYHYSGSLYPCIALHSANNALALGSLEGWGGLTALVMIGSVLTALGIAMTLARIAGGGGVPAPAAAT